tara:strand:+ start:311 stop:415 length:105 start_codon:yes stop_codon:yes gene_type:complete
MMVVIVMGKAEQLVELLLVVVLLVEVLQIVKVVY